jgi:hypothetical protein
MRLRRLSRGAEASASRLVCTVRIVRPDCCVRCGIQDSRLTEPRFDVNCGYAGSICEFSGLGGNFFSSDLALIRTGLEKKRFIALLTRQARVVTV